MSVRVTTRVWENSRSAGSALLLMLAIADQANDEGLCWPSVGSLSQKTRMSKREVQYLIRDLVSSGELDVLRGGGRGRSSMYRVKVQGLHRSGTAPDGNGAESAPFSDDGPKRVQPSAEKGAKSDERVQPSAEKGATQRLNGAMLPRANMLSARGTVLTVLTEPSLRTVKEPSRERARESDLETERNTDDSEDERSSPCGVCGAPIPLSNGWQPYCSDACRAKAKPRPSSGVMG